MYQWYSIVLRKLLKVSFEKDKLKIALQKMSKIMKSDDVPKHITDLIDIGINEIEYHDHEVYIKNAIKELRKI